MKSCLITPAECQEMWITSLLQWGQNCPNWNIILIQSKTRVGTTKRDHKIDNGDSVIMSGLAQTPAQNPCQVVYINTSNIEIYKRFLVLVMAVHTRKSSKKSCISIFEIQAYTEAFFLPYQDQDFLSFKSWERSFAYSCHGHSEQQWHFLTLLLSNCSGRSLNGGQIGTEILY